MGAADKRTYHNRSSDYHVCGFLASSCAFYSLPSRLHQPLYLYADFDYFVLLWTIGAARAYESKTRLHAAALRARPATRRGGVYPTEATDNAPPRNSHTRRRLPLSSLPLCGRPSRWPGCMKKRARERREHSQAPRQQATFLCVYLTRLSPLSDLSVCVSAPLSAISHSHTLFRDHSAPLLFLCAHSTRGRRRKARLLLLLLDLLSHR